MAHDRGFERVERGNDRGATQFITEAFKEADRFIKGRSINPESFTNFDPTMVKRDKEWAEKLYKDFVQSNSLKQREEAMVSTVFEVSLWWLVRNKKFFGEQTTALLPSRYDDLKGTDLILEMMSSDEQLSQLGLGIDATFGHQAVIDKLGEIGILVSAGKTNEIKYYESSDGKIKGSLLGVPHAIVGLSVGRAREVAALWRNTAKGEKLYLEPDKHPLRALVLMQLVYQARALSALARAHGHEQLAQSYATAFNRLQPVHEQAEREVPNKSWMALDGEDYRKDPVHLAIISQCMDWQQAAKQKRAPSK